MITRANLRYWQDPLFRARMLAYGRRYEKAHRRERNRYKRVYRKTLSPLQRKRARAACRRWYAKNRSRILARAARAYRQKHNHR